MQNKYKNYSQRGFTLVELMIGMLLGVFILGGVISVFVSSAETARAKRNLDNAQEAFRFAGYTISRIVRNSDGFAASSDLTLVVNDPNPNPANPNIVNCLGSPAIGGTSTFVFSPDPSDSNNGQLICNNEVLAEGFDMTAVGFKYGLWDEEDIGDGKWIADEDYKSAATIGNWDNVISVRVIIQTNTGLNTVFTAASRARVLVE